MTSIAAPTAVSTPAGPLMLVVLAAVVAAGAGPLATPAAAQLAGTGNDRFTQSATAEVEEVNDHFGAALAAGDFNGDQRADLAVGVPDEDVGAVVDAGMVIVFYGTPAGLNTDSEVSPAPLVLHQNVTAVLDVAEEGDRFGAALTAGDFNGDGYDELAVGVPGEGIEIEPGIVVPGAGLVQIFTGLPGGILAAVDDTLSEFDFWGEAVGNDAFGSALAACDRNVDGYDDLVVGIPLLDAPPLDAGFMILFKGASTGLESTIEMSWGGGGATTAPESGDRFGTTVACGRIDSGTVPEIAVGAPWADAAGAGADAGIVRVLHGNLSLSEDSETHTNGRYGLSLVILDGEQAGSRRLLAGYPGRDDSGPTVDQAGGMMQLGGPVSILQGDGGMLESPEPFDQFGQTATAGDFNGDGFPDLAVGAPGENLGAGTPEAFLDAGTVAIAHGTRAGITAAFNQNWNWGVSALGYSNEGNERFGAALAAGDFDGNGADDLAIGAPGTNFFHPGTGMVQIIYGTRSLLFADDFDIGTTAAWSVTTP